MGLMSPGAVVDSLAEHAEAATEALQELFTGGGSARQRRLTRLVVAVVFAINLLVFVSNLHRLINKQHLPSSPLRPTIAGSRPSRVCRIRVLSPRPAAHASKACVSPRLRERGVGAGAEPDAIEYPPVFDVNEMFGKHRHPFASQAYKEFVRDESARPIPGTPPLRCPAFDVGARWCACCLYLCSV